MCAKANRTENKYHKQKAQECLISLVTETRVK